MLPLCKAGNSSDCRFLSHRPIVRLPKIVHYSLCMCREECMRSCLNMCVCVYISIFMTILSLNISVYNKLQRKSIFRYLWYLKVIRSTFKGCRIKVWMSPCSLYSILASFSSDKPIRRQPCFLSATELSLSELLKCFQKSKRVYGVFIPSGLEGIDSLEHMSSGRLN